MSTPAYSLERVFRPRCRKRKPKQSLTISLHWEDRVWSSGRPRWLTFSGKSARKDGDTHRENYGALQKDPLKISAKHTHDETIKVEERTVWEEELAQSSSGKKAILVDRVAGFQLAGFLLLLFALYSLANQRAKRLQMWGHLLLWMWASVKNFWPPGDYKNQQGFSK